MKPPGSANVEDPAPKPRFRWPMRIFLTLLVFDIVFRSLVVLLPYDEWARDLKVAAYPKALPTRDQVQQLSAGAGSETGDPVGRRVMESMDSTWDYLKPWPSAESRARMRSGPDLGKFYLCWLSTRLEFGENLVGINQDWPMFSPNVGRYRTVARPVLVFADGSQRMIRLTADPEDLTRYSHWFEEKVLDYELKVDRDYDTRMGYCNYLAYRHRTNADGAPLAKILIFRVSYRLPGPGEDAAAVLGAQNGPPPDQIDPPFYGLWPQYPAVIAADPQAGGPAAVPWAALALCHHKEVRKTVFVYDVPTRTGRWLPE